jgi:hypothetical protein
MVSSNERTCSRIGCFLGTQDLLRRYLGVISTRVGYTGGKVANATYRNHKGHAEAIVFFALTNGATCGRFGSHEIFGKFILKAESLVRR